MPVTEILILRHGHRLAWTFTPSTRTYTSAHPFPSGLPADPPLASHGVRQSHETAAHLSKLLRPQILEDRLVIYSSLFYRCLETLRPTVEACHQMGWKGKVRGAQGVSEWFGSAPFEQPAPGQWRVLRDSFFPWLEGAESSAVVVPSRYGESIDELHDRMARALESIVTEVDRDYEKKGRGGEDVTLLICGHAAPIIATGRALTGRVPLDYSQVDFQCFTCGLSRFVRRDHPREASGADDQGGSGEGAWRRDGGVAGGWECVLNSSCEHLSEGEERGWHFHGEESFDSYGPPQVHDGAGPASQKVRDTNEERINGSKL